MKVFALLLSLFVTHVFAEIADNDTINDPRYQEYQQFRDAVTEGFLQVNERYGNELRLSAMMSACGKRELAAAIAPRQEDISSLLLNLKGAIPEGVSPLIFLGAVQISISTYGVGVMEFIKQSMNENM